MIHQNYSNKFKNTYTFLNTHKAKPRRPLSTGIISAKNVTHQHGFEPTTSCLQGRRTTICATVTSVLNGILFEIDESFLQIIDFNL